MTLAMSTPDPFEIFLVCPPGLEHVLATEVAEAGFDAPVASVGGVTIQGGWPDVWRANLCLRGAVRVPVLGSAGGAGPGQRARWPVPR